MRALLLILLAACGSNSENARPYQGPEGSSGERLGEFRTVTPTGAQSDERGNAEVGSDRLIAEPSSRGELCPIHHGEFACATRFRIRDVPSGVHFVRVGDGAWEIVQGNRRVALIEERAWSGASQPLAQTSRTVQLAHWGNGPARVVLEQFGDDTVVYRIERREHGTDWIGHGWTAR